MRSLSILAMSVALAAASSANATVVIDPVGDTLATYTGPASGDLDIVSASATFDGTNFLVSSTLNGPVGTTIGSLFVWGINRGAGTPRLTFGSPSIGAGVLFDAVVVLFPDGTLRVATLPAMGPPTITNFAGGATINGNTISGSAPLSLLFSTGFNAGQYTFSNWSRARVNPLVDGTNAEIADFAPSQGSVTATAVPEPSTWLAMLIGFAMIGGAVRGRRGRRALRPL